jgi:hypothetical protein
MKRDDYLRDPEFHSLVEIERLKLLWKADPEYRRLTPKERWKVVCNLPKLPVPNPPPE